MENAIKHRLIGAVVVVALAVIFVPMILSSEEGTLALHAEQKQVKKAAVEIEDEDVRALNEITLPQHSNTVAKVEESDIIEFSNEPEDIAALVNESPTPPQENQAIEADQIPAQTAAPVEAEAREIAPSIKAIQPNQAIPKNTPTDVKASKKSSATIATKSKTNASIALKIHNKEAWCVQVGTFSSQQNAVAFQAKLKKKGYETYLRQVNAKQSSLTRLYVGPTFDKNKAESLKRSLNNDFRVHGMVLSYQPSVKG